nr:TSUP family transporter [Sphingomonas piscis]
MLMLAFAVGAALYSSVGHGGASAYLAAMALLGVAPDVMRPTALALNLLVAGLGTWRFARRGLTNWRLVAAFALTATPAAFLGGLLNLPPLITSRWWACCFGSLPFACFGNRSSSRTQR